MANSAFFLTSCIREKLHKKDQNTPDENWSWRASDLSAQGKTPGSDVLDWQTVQRGKPGAPVFYANAGTSPKFRAPSTLRFENPGEKMALFFDQIPQPIKDEYYLRWHGTFDRKITPSKRVCLYRQVIPESPYDLVRVDWSHDGSGLVTLYVVFFDTLGGTDPGNGWAGRHEVTLTSDKTGLRTNYGTQVKLFFDSTGFTWEMQASDSSAARRGRYEAGRPLYKPKGSVQMHLNTNGADSSEDGAGNWYNLGMGNSVATAPPYP